jgi:hypothetical protein
MERQAAYDRAVECLAPCGIDCERCVMYAKGRVRNLADGLTKALTGFENMAPRVADRFPALSAYGEFRAVLDLLAGASCAGCREGGSVLPFCAARRCFKEQGVDFCFQCAEYPCDRNDYPQNLNQRWRACNDRMREVGVERYYLESLDRPRY